MSPPDPLSPPSHLQISNRHHLPPKSRQTASKDALRAQHKAPLAARHTRKLIPEIKRPDRYPTPTSLIPNRNIGILRRQRRRRPSAEHSESSRAVKAVHGENPDPQSSRAPGLRAHEPLALGQRMQWTRDRRTPAPTPHAMAAPAAPGIKDCW